jgi:hypothetical protein
MGGRANDCLELIHFPPELMLNLSKPLLASRLQILNQTLAAGYGKRLSLGNLTVLNYLGTKKPKFLVERAIKMGDLSSYRTMKCYTFVCCAWALLVHSVYVNDFMQCIWTGCLPRSHDHHPENKQLHVKITSQLPRNMLLLENGSWLPLTVLVLALLLSI